jgi:hypothetical protein
MLSEYVMRTDCEYFAGIMNVRLTACHAIQLQFDISANALGIRAV